MGPMIECGTVLRYHGVRGFGFLMPDGAAPSGQVFYHVNDIIGDELPEVGDRVRFQIQANPKGPRAVNVLRLDGGDDDMDALTSGNPKVRIDSLSTAVNHRPSP